MKTKPHVLILGGNFAGLQVARHIRDHVKPEDASVTVVDKRSYLLFIPNILMEILENKNPDSSMQLPLAPVLDKDETRFIQAEVLDIDVESKKVTIQPTERPGTTTDVLTYDYLVIALGNRLAFDKIDGFAEHGHTVSDGFYGNKLRHYLHEGGYKGGPIAIGSARFHQGTKGKLDFVPMAKAACEGPPVEIALSLASWMKHHEMGGPEKVTIFPPADLIAEDAGKNIVKQLLEIAGGMGFGYKNKLEDIKQIGKDGIEFANGESIEAELKIILPDWVPHEFLKGLPICDEKGFVITNKQLKNPDYPEVYAAGDAAACTVPKLGSIGHHQSYIVARQLARDLGALSDEEADSELYSPEVICYGDMGDGKAFYIHSNVWYGGDIEILKMGKLYYDLKVAFKTSYFAMGGKVPYWQWKMGSWMGDKIL